MNKRVRTRFAPSPTGYMHIGNLRTALYAYLIAKKQDGDFILRIEDTDQERYVEGAVDVIYDTLRVAGLNWDEGPDIGGPVGPYVQSERMGMFKSYAEELVKSGHAYYCFCDKERLDEVRKIQEASHIAPMYRMEFNFRRNSALSESAFISSNTSSKLSSVSVFGRPYGKSPLFASLRNASKISPAPSVRSSLCADSSTSASFNSSAPVKRSWMPYYQW